MDTCRDNPLALLQVTCISKFQSYFIYFYEKLFVLLCCNMYNPRANHVMGMIYWRGQMCYKSLHEISNVTILYFCHIYLFMDRLDCINQLWFCSFTYTTRNVCLWFPLEVGAHQPFRNYPTLSEVPQNSNSFTRNLFTGITTLKFT